MKLNEISQSKATTIKRALKEHFEVSPTFENLNVTATKNMLSRVRGLITEARTSKQAHARHQDPAYMKLVMMEQALSDQYQTLRVEREIMLENEEVQKSQVILAAQDMIDSVQKMVEQISKMKVEELPAVVTGVTNEIGTSEGEQFNTTVSEALGVLETALSTAKNSLNSALGQITGEGGGDFGGEEEVDFGGEEELPAPGGEEEIEFGGEEELPALPEPEEPEEVGNAGRSLR